MMERKEHYVYMNKFQYTNCWHINESESAALWKLYSDSNNSIAIQSTIERLKKSLRNSPEQICLSEIQYRDYAISFDSMMEATKNPDARGNEFNPGTFKRKSFEHERELRAIHRTLTDPNFQEHLNEDPKTPIGKKINCDIKILLETVYVAPKADLWFKDLIVSLIQRFNIHIPVKQSNLYNRLTIK